MNYRINVFLVLLLLLLCFSCNKGNKSPINSKQCLKLYREVEVLQQNLPRQIDKGIMLVKAEYVDSFYTTWVEVDDNFISFADMMTLGERRKKEILSDATISHGKERDNYEMYVEYNIRMRMIYMGKYNHKQTEFTVTPSEIDEALHTKADAYSKLQMLVFCSKAKSSESLKGVSDPIMTLQDSIVYMTFIFDESMYDVMSLKEAVSTDDIMEELQVVNPKLLRYMADANCGFAYRIIGSRSKKGFDINISSKEVLYYKSMLDSKFEIVESEE